MIFYPVEGRELINRFLALIVGTIFIMIIQIDSAKVRYAIRLAIVGLFTVFIAKLFNKEEKKQLYKKQ